jgi:hypothetical protein
MKNDSLTIDDFAEQLRAHAYFYRKRRAEEFFTRNGSWPQMTMEEWLADFNAYVLGKKIEEL